LFTVAVCEGGAMGVPAAAVCEDGATGLPAAAVCEDGATGLPAAAVCEDGAEAGDRNVRVSQMTPNQSATANTAAIATRLRVRFRRLNGVVGLKRPYPSVCKTASV
jgi:hypothetical protein